MVRILIRRAFWLLLLIYMLFSCSQRFDIVRFIDGEHIRPVVTDCSLADTETGVDLTVDITIQFSVVMDRSITEDAVTLRRGGRWDVPVRYVWNSTYTAVTVRPVSALVDNNPYLLTVDSAVRSDYGYTMENDYTVRFTTLILDYEAPTVLGSEPDDGALNFLPDDGITIFFSEPMDIESVGDESTNGTVGAFRLYNPDNIEVIGTLSWSSDKRNLYFDPRDDLLAFEQYRIEIGLTASDPAGNTLQSVYTAEFLPLGTYTYLTSVPVDEPLVHGVNAHDELYVFDASQDRVMKFEAHGTLLLAWDESSDCHGIAIDSRGDVYLADTANHRIKKYDANGYYYGWLGKGNLTTGWHNHDSTENPVSGSESGAFLSPEGLAFDSAGRLFVADTGNNRVVAFNSDLTYVSAFGESGTLDGQFQAVCAVSFDADGNVYTVDRGNNRISVFDTEFNGVRSWGGLNAPSDVVVDEIGAVYVVDTGFKLVRRFTGDGILTTQFGTVGSDDELLDSPVSVTIGSDGRLYVSDRGAGAVKIYRVM